MAALGIPHLLIVLVIVALVIGSRRFTRGYEDSLPSRARSEAGRMPVYSAETTHGKEAEFIRERLPARLSAVLALVAILVFGALAWWWYTRGAA